VPAKAKPKKRAHYITDKEPAMKFRHLKKQGYAALREKLGLSQTQLAEQLGISKATVSMAESGRRSLPTAALLKIAALEIKLAAAMETGPVHETEKSNIDLPAEAPPEFSQLCQQQCEQQLYKLTTKLETMEAVHKKLRAQLQLLESMLEKEPAEPGNILVMSLQLHRDRLLSKISRCDPKEQALLRNKVAKLKVEANMNRSMSQLPAND
jgi:transcriptional regulator with XRE-family HTH domain